MLEISQVPEEETLLTFIVGDALRFSMRIVDPDPDSPDPENPVMVPRNLTGYTVAAQIRKSRKKTDPILAQFEFNTLDETGEIHAYLTAEESSKMDGVSSARWDLQLTDTLGDPITLLYGPAKPPGQVTR